MEYQKRKHPRLKDFDYSDNGIYFITICTKDRQPMLCDVIGAPQHIMKLTQNGEIADKYINSISKHYENISVDKYVIMPDHIHILLSTVGRGDSTRRNSGSSQNGVPGSSQNGVPGSSQNGVPGSSRPTVSQIVGVLKRLINKEIGKNIFQTSFNDHIIRDERDYLIHLNYIENNPVKWIKEGEHK